jgi:DNA polymerase III subunit gamma/tau
VRADPLVQAVLERFPGAEIVEVRAPVTNSPDVVNDLPAASHNDGDVADSDR